MSAPTIASRVCRGCGCTDDDGCLVLSPRSDLGSRPWGMEANATGCWWVEDDLCCGCAEPARLLRGPVADHRAPAQ